MKSVQYHVIHLRTELMYSESHTPGIYKLTNESARFKQPVVGVASSAS